MLLLTLFVILVGFASYKSFQVAGSTKTHYRADELKAREDKEKAALASAYGSSIELCKRQLAETLWQENQFGEAKKLESEVNKEPEPKGYDAEFVENNLTSASLKLDAGDFSEVLKLYQAVLAYDRKTLGDSCRQVARDLNSLGVASYLAGQACEEPDKRNSYFWQACDYYTQAVAITGRQVDDPEHSFRLERILANRELAIRDLNKANQAPFDFNKSPNNQML